MLINNLIDIQLEELDLSLCDISNINSIEMFLEKNETLKRLELKGNLLSECSIFSLGRGLKMFKGKLTYLGLAENPISCYAFKYLLDNIGFEQITDFDISGTDLDTYAIRYFIRFLATHSLMSSIKINSLKLDNQLGESLIKYLESNNIIKRVGCKCCNLSINQEREIQELLFNRKHKLCDLFHE